MFWRTVSLKVLCDISQGDKHFIDEVTKETTANFCKCWLSKTIFKFIFIAVDVAMFEIDKDKYWSLLDIRFILFKFCQMCGIELSSETVENISKNPCFQFSSVDIKQFFPIVKYPAVLDYYSGKYLMEKVCLSFFCFQHSTNYMLSGEGKRGFNSKNSVFLTSMPKNAVVWKFFPIKKVQVRRKNEGKLVDGKG